MYIILHTQTVLVVLFYLMFCLSQAVVAVQPVVLIMQPRPSLVTHHTRVHHLGLFDIRSIPVQSHTQCQNIRCINQEHPSQAPPSYSHISQGYDQAAYCHQIATRQIASQRPSRM